MKKQNGITLIALIITIIVMLILVAVTVNIALNGGLFDTAKEAAKKTEIAQMKEQLFSVEVSMNADLEANQEKFTADMTNNQSLWTLLVNILAEIRKDERFYSKKRLYSIK